MILKKKQHHSSLNTTDAESALKSVNHTETSSSKYNLKAPQNGKNQLKPKQKLPTSVLTQNQTNKNAQSTSHQMNKVETRLKSQPSSSVHLSKNMMGYTSNYSVMKNILKQNKSKPNSSSNYYASPNNISKLSLRSGGVSKPQLNERFQTQVQTTVMSDDNFEDGLNNSFFYKEDDDLQIQPGQTVVNMIPVSPNKKHKLNNELDFFASKKIMPSSLLPQKPIISEVLTSSNESNQFGKNIHNQIPLINVDQILTNREGASLLQSQNRCETVANCEENLQINNQQISRKIVNKSLSSVNNQKVQQQQQVQQMLSQQQLEIQLQQIQKLQIESQNCNLVQSSTPKQLSQQQPYQSYKQEIPQQQQQSQYKQKQQVETSQKSSIQPHTPQSQITLLNQNFNMAYQQYEQQPKLQQMPLQNKSISFENQLQNGWDQNRKTNTISNVCVTQSSPLKYDAKAVQHTEGQYDNRRESNQMKLKYNCTSNTNMSQNSRDLFSYYEQVLTPSLNGRRISFNFKENNNHHHHSSSVNQNSNNRNQITQNNNSYLQNNLKENNGNLKPQSVSKINVNTNVSDKSNINNIPKSKQPNNNVLHNYTSSLNSYSSSNNNYCNSLNNTTSTITNTFATPNNVNVLLNENSNQIQNKKHQSFSYANNQNTNNQHTQHYSNQASEMNLKSQLGSTTSISLPTDKYSQGLYNGNQRMNTNTSYYNDLYSKSINQDTQNGNSNTQNSYSQLGTYDQYNNHSYHHYKTQYKYDINSTNPTNSNNLSSQTIQTQNTKLSQISDVNNTSYQNNNIHTTNSNNQSSSNISYPKPLMNQNIYLPKSNQTKQNTKQNDKLQTEVLLTERNNKSTDFSVQNVTQINSGNTNSGQKSLIDTIKDNIFSLVAKTFRGSTKRDQCNCDEDLVDMQTCSRAQKWLEWNYPENLDNLRTLYNSIKESRSGIVDPSVLSQIKLDVTRTYPHLKLFQTQLQSSENQQNSSDQQKNKQLQVAQDGVNTWKQPFGLEQLEDILYSFAAYDPQIGYVQGINFIAAHFLYHAEEYIAFWLLVDTFERFELRDIYLPNLPGLKKHSFILEKILEKIDPELFSHMNENGVKPEMYITPWLFTQFGMMIPLKYLDIFYENMIQEGWTFFYKFIIAYMQENREEIMSEDMMGIIEILKRKNNQISNDKYSEEKEWSDLINQAKSIKIRSKDIETMINTISFQD